MNTLSTIIDPLGWALLHFLWQGAVIALLLRGCFWLTRRCSPQVRYAAAGAAMLLMLGAAVGTVVWQWPAVRAETTVGVEGKNATDGRNGKDVAATLATISLPEHSSDPSPLPPISLPLPAEEFALPALAAESATTADRLRPLLPWMVGVWAAGVLFFSLRLLNGWRVVRRWRASADSTIPGDWAHRFSRLCQRLGITRSVRLLSSATLAVPVIIGWLKPAVLVPASLFAGLTAGQLEALLAHELAHVRRHDYLVNLLQSMLETLFFYHPAVWWVSGQLRKEREHCCDDAATVHAGGVLDYARALTALEEMRAMPALLGVSAAGGSLLQRIRRLAGVSEQRVSSFAWPLGMLTLAAAAIALPFSMLHAAESDFAAPQAAHVSTGKHSAYCVHNGKEANFILIAGTPFSSISSSGANPKLRTWHDDGTITFDGGGEVIFSRKSANAGTLNLTYSSGKEGALTTTAYELAKGRVLLVAPDIAPRQFDKPSPPVTAQEALMKLFDEIAAEVQTRQGAGPDAASGNTVAATVNGRPVLKSEVDALMKTGDMELRRRITDQAELNAEMKKLRSKVLNSLIDQELILNEFAPFAETFGPKVEAQAEERIGKQFVDGMFKGDRRKFIQELVDSGIGYANFLEQQKKNIIVEMMRGQFAEVDRPLVTGEEKADWLKKHGGIFRTGEKLKLRSLTIPGTAEEKTQEQQRALADEVRASLVNGADFAALARTHSTDSKRDAGGSWDWVEKKDLAGAFWSIVSALEPGKISDVIPFRGSFYIFLVEDRQEGEMKPQAEIDAEVERRIQTERRQKASEAWLKKLREKATMKIVAAAAGDSDPAGPQAREPAKPGSLNSLDKKPSPALPSATLQFRLVADREGPDTEAMEPVENWSELPTFHLRKSPVLTAADVKSATVELDRESKDTGKWRINLVFTEEGAAALANATKEHLGRQLAIVGNGKVISAPLIQGEMGKQVILSGNYLESEAKELAEAIQAAASAKGTTIVPAMDRNGELVINVAADGSISIAGESLTLDVLNTKLIEIAKQDKKHAIIIRGDTRTGYDKIIRILNLTHEAGLYYVSFATKTTAEGDRKSAAEKLLEESFSLSTVGKNAEARAKLSELSKLPGKPDDPGFHAEYLLLLADAELILGRLDREEARRLNTETPDARQAAAKLRETALNHFTDAAKLLLAYDSKDKKSVPCRTRLANAYFEMGGVLVANDSTRDTSVAYGEAVKIYTALVQEEPGNAAHSVGLAKTYDAAAVLLRAVKPGDVGVREALDYQQYSATLLRPLIKNGPKNISVVLQLAASLKLNGDLHRALGDTAAADAAYKEGTSLMDSLSDAEKIRGAQDRMRRSFFGPGTVPDVNDGEKKPETFPRIMEHKDGTRTESVHKDGTVRESTFNKDGLLTGTRVFMLDKQNRPRQGVIYDGKMNPVGSILFGYDPKTDQPLEERQFNKEARLIRRLFYPGALKEPEYAGRFVAFSYDPDDPKAKPVVDAAEAKPSLPVSDLKTPDVAGEVKRQIALAQGFYDLGQYEKARDGYEQALKLDPSNEEVRKLMEQAISKLAHQSNPYAVPKDPKTLAEARQKSISMSVLDSTGQKPLAEFRVIAGVRSGVGGEKDVVNWQPHTLQVGTNGGMLWPLDKAYDEMALRVEADGYMPQVFNWLEKKKGPQDLFFQMVEAKGMPVRILTPDGKPAAGAVAALAMVQRDAVIEGGKLRHADEALPEKASDGWRWPRIIKADADGKILLPAENDPTAALLVLHESGVREMSVNDFTRGLYPWTGGGPHPQITLQPWGRIEGKVQWGDKAGAGQKVSLTIHRDSYGYPGVIAQYEKTTSAADGSFVFEKVLPGRCQLSCPIAAEPGNKRGVTEMNLTGRIAHVEVKPGPNEAVIGGGGRTVKGKLTGRNSWDGVTFHFHPTAPHIGFRGDDEMWKAFGEFKKSPAGPLFFREGLKVKADGTFEITGVLPGSYQIFFKREGEDKYLASGKFHVEAEVPGKKVEPVDAGEFPARK